MKKKQIIKILLSALVNQHPDTIIYDEQDNPISLESIEREIDLKGWLLRKVTGDLSLEAEKNSELAECLLLAYKLGQGVSDEKYQQHLDKAIIKLNGSITATNEIADLEPEEEIINPQNDTETAVEESNSDENIALDSANSLTNDDIEQNDNDSLAYEESMIAAINEAENEAEKNEAATDSSAELEEAEAETTAEPSNETINETTSAEEISPETLIAEAEAETSEQETTLSEAESEIEANLDSSMNAEKELDENEDFADDPLEKMLSEATSLPEGDDSGVEVDDSSVEIDAPVVEDDELEVKANNPEVEVDDPIVEDSEANQEMLAAQEKPKTPVTEASESSKKTVQELRAQMGLMEKNETSSDTEKTPSKPEPVTKGSDNIVELSPNK